MMSITPIPHSSSTDSFETLQNTSPKKRPREGDAEESSTEVSPIDALSRDGLRCVFRLLSLRELTEVAPVCKFWNKTAADDSFWDVSRLKELYPSIQVFSGEKREDQRSFFLKTLVPTVNQFNQLNILDDDGVSIVTVPEGTTLNNLREKEEIQNSVKTNYGDQETCGTWVMTNSGLVETENLTYEEQKAIVEAQGLEMSEFLPTFALCKKAKTLLGADPITYVRCKETIKDEHVMVGGSDEMGAKVRTDRGYDKLYYLYTGAMKKV